MRNRRKLLILLASVLIVGGALLWFASDSEPSYQDRPLRDWLVELGTNRVGRAPLPAIEAIRHLGTNSIPLLVRYANRMPTGWRLRWFRAKATLGRRLGRNWEKPGQEIDVPLGAFEALKIHGPAAEAAIPDLIRMIRSTEAPSDNRRAGQAVLTLGYIGPAALPALLSALTNQPSPVRWQAAMGLSQLGSSARPAVPVLVEKLKDADASLAQAAATVLGGVRLEPALVVPALINALRDSRPVVRRAAVTALFQFEARARPAVPALQELLNDPDELTRVTAKTALRVITPTPGTNAPPQ